jgi:alpha,alpha-trehalose phosphorylase
MVEGEILSYQRHLHLDKGFSERIIEWRSQKGKEIKLTFKRIVSFVDQEVLIQEVKLESLHYNGRVRIVSTINGDVSNFVDTGDPRVSSSHAKLLKVTQAGQMGSFSYVECETNQYEA